MASPNPVCRPAAPHDPALRSGATVVIGIDPGLQRTGYAILAATGDRWRPRVCEAGVIRLDPRQALDVRLVELQAGLLELLERHRPQILACEQLYAHYKHPRTAILMGHARGVILAACAARGLAVRSLAATMVKKTLTGSGRAGKVQMQRAVATTLGLAEAPQPHDVADAIAIALTGLWRESGGANLATSAAQPQFDGDARRSTRPARAVRHAGVHAATVTQLAVGL